MHPTYIEVFLLEDGRYGWSVGFPDPDIDRCGEEPTLTEALAAVVKIVEGETK